MTRNRISVITTTAAMVFALVITVVGFTSKVAAQKNTQLPNETIQREVMHQLRMLNRYTVFDNIAFAVDGNRVTLEGQVVNPELKSEAAAVVKTVPGVTEVQNNIKTLPLSNDDDRIRRAAYRSIYGDSQLTKYGFEAVQAIHIIVDNGHITLEGTVDSEADKNVAGIRANSVEGAFSMKNNLLVRGER
jgi:hyperosmotically inducible periplasmic protein